MTDFNTQMNFEIIRDSVQAILEAEASDNGYEVIKYEKQTNSVADANTTPKVVCSYIMGNMPGLDNSQVADQNKHKCTYKIKLWVAEKSNDSASGFFEAGVAADLKMDELIRRVWNVLMQGENLYLGTDNTERFGIISGRAIENIEKQPMQRDGSLAVIVADMDLTCQTVEVSQSITGLDIEAVDTTMEINEDTNAQQGVINDYT